MSEYHHDPSWPYDDSNCSIPETPRGFVSSNKQVLVDENGLRYVGCATGTSVISQDDADLRAFQMARAQALTGMNVVALLDENGRQLAFEDNFSIADEPI